MDSSTHAGQRAPRIPKTKNNLLSRNRPDYQFACAGSHGRHSGPPPTNADEVNEIIEIKRGEVNNFKT